MKKYIRPVLSFLLVMVIGFLFGFMLGFFVNLESLAFDGMHWFTLILVICLAFYIALPIQILVHEGGHLFFGLLTGYRFVSFRLFSLVLTRSNGHWKLKRYALCGTAGQCLMLPPIINDRQHPYLLYNLGGIILNLASSFIMLLCLVVLPVNAYWLLFGLIFCLVGFYFAVVNALPAASPFINNDGRNALEIWRHLSEIEGFDLQLMVAGKLAKGLRPGELPLDSYEEKTYDVSLLMSAATLMLLEARALDRHDFSTVLFYVARLTDKSSAVPVLYKHLLEADALYVELVSNASLDHLSSWQACETRQLMKKMKRHLSVLRTQFAYALLYENDQAKAAKIRQRFEKVARMHPHPGEVVSERELMDLAICCKK